MLHITTLNNRMHMLLFFVVVVVFVVQLSMDGQIVLFGNFSAKAVLFQTSRTCIRSFLFSGVIDTILNTNMFKQS